MLRTLSLCDEKGLTALMGQALHMMSEDIALGRSRKLPATLARGGRGGGRPISGGSGVAPRKTPVDLTIAYSNTNDQVASLRSSLLKATWRSRR
jgi:hypothetical protein